MKRILELSLVLAITVSYMSKKQKNKGKKENFKENKIKQ